MPELPEIQAHAERLDREFAGRVLTEFRPLSFTVLKTALPVPDDAVGLPLRRVSRRGKYMLLEFQPVTFAIHLMQGGRLTIDTKRSAKPRGGQARFSFAPTDHDTDQTALLLTEAGTERRAGVWCMPTERLLVSPPLDPLGPEADAVDPDELLTLLGRENRRLHGALRDQHTLAGLGRRLANEVCHRARISPFSMTGRLDLATCTTIVESIRDAVTEGLEFEREQPDMVASKDRPGRVHGHTGQPCPVCGDVIRAVEYSGYTVNYCTGCQTGGKVLADNTTSRFLK